MANDNDDDDDSSLPRYNSLRNLATTDMRKAQCTLLKSKGRLVLLFTGLTHVHDVGEEVVVVRLGHGVAEFWRVLEQADEDHEAVQVAVL